MVHAMRFNPGDKVMRSGYEGVVIRENLADMYEVRLSSGVVVTPSCELTATQQPD